MKDSTIHEMIESQIKEEQRIHAQGTADLSVNQRLWAIFSPETSSLNRQNEGNPGCLSLDTRGLSSLYSSHQKTRSYHSSF